MASSLPLPCGSWWIPKSACFRHLHLLSHLTWLLQYFINRNYLNQDRVLSFTLDDENLNLLNLSLLFSLNKLVTISHSLFAKVLSSIIAQLLLQTYFSPYWLHLEIWWKHCCLYWLLLYSPHFPPRTYTNRISCPRTYFNSHKKETYLWLERWTNG